MEEVTLPKLEAKRAEAKGVFKGKKRKSLDKEIADLQKAIQKKKDSISANVKAEVYPDAQTFFAAYRKAEVIVPYYTKFRLFCYPYFYRMSFYGIALY